jgi:hypothetical protein
MTRTRAAAIGPIGNRRAPAIDDRGGSVPGKRERGHIVVGFRV